MEKRRARVFPRRAFWIAAGVVLPGEDLMVFLCFAAFRTSVVSSWGVRSAMERRWRGAKGEVVGVEGVE